jgi:hypothetical protein
VKYVVRDREYHSRQRNAGDCDDDGAFERPTPTDRE